MSNTRLDLQVDVYNNEYSFTENTFSLTKMFPHKATSSNGFTATKLGEYFLSERSEARKKYDQDRVRIVGNMRDADCLCPVPDGKIFKINLARAVLGENFIGYYIDNILINPASGDAFLSMITSEPFIHYIVDYISENFSQYELDNKRILNVEIPQYIAKTYKANNVLDTSYGSFMSGSTCPTAIIEVKDLPIRLVGGRPRYVISEEGELPQEFGVKYFYRNFDMYAKDGRLVNGELGYNMYGPEIEQAFTDLDVIYVNPGITDKYNVDTVITDSPDYIRGSFRAIYSNLNLAGAKHSLFEFSGEPYEQPVQLALELGRTYGFKDTINDVLGRFVVDKSSVKFSPEQGATSQIFGMYYGYISEVGFFKEPYMIGKYAPDVVTLDSKISNVGSIQKDFIEDYIIDYSVLDSTNISTGYKRFNCIKERSMLLKECVRLSLPTITLADKVDYIEDSYMPTNASRKPLICIAGKNTMFTYSMLAPSRFSDNLSGSKYNVKELILREFYTNHKDNLVYGNKAVVSPLIKFKGIRNSTVMIEPQQVGCSEICNMPIPYNINKMYLNTRLLKTLLLGEYDIYDGIGFDLSKVCHLTPIKDTEDSVEGYLKKSGEILYSFPEDWHSIQGDVDFISSSSGISATSLDAGNGKHYQFNTSSVKVLGRVVGWDELVNGLKSFNNDSLKDVELGGYFNMDPARNIRQSMRSYEQDERSNNVMGFDKEQTSNDKNTSLRQRHPINAYLLGKNVNTHDIIYPLLGTYCKIGTDEIYERFDVVPVNIEVEAPKEPTRFMSAERRILS